MFVPDRNPNPPEPMRQPYDDRDGDEERLQEKIRQAKANQARDNQTEEDKTK